MKEAVTTITKETQYKLTELWACMEVRAKDGSTHENIGGNLVSDYEVEHSYTEGNEKEVKLYASLTTSGRYSGVVQILIATNDGMNRIVARAQQVGNNCWAFCVRCDTDKFPFYEETIKRSVTHMINHLMGKE